jgi:uridine phosphorylase
MIVNSLSITSRNSAVERKGVPIPGSLESWPMPARTPVHLRPTAAVAERALLPGDPGRALALAQLLLEKPLMFNHHRGLWGYTGPAVVDGEPLTVQSTGMGGPSAAIVLQELVALGVRRAVRVGTCGALDGGLALGDLVVAGEALAADGTSRALGAGERVAADPGLTGALSSGAAGRGGEGDGATARGGESDGAAARGGATIVSTDLFYEPSRDREREWRAAGAVAVEMEAAALFTVGARAGISVACLLAVSNMLGEDPAERAGHIDDDALLAAAEAMGRLALSALV